MRKTFVSAIAVGIVTSVLAHVTARAETRSLESAECQTARAKMRQRALVVLYFARHPDAPVEVSSAAREPLEESVAEMKALRCTTDDELRRQRSDDKRR